MHEKRRASCGGAALVQQGDRTIEARKEILREQRELLAKIE
jgi:hypothetical protein